MGSNQGRRNNFQIELGFANLAIGLPAILAVTLDWGITVEAGFVLAYALYFAQVTVLVLMDSDDGKVNLFRAIMMFMQAGLLGYFALSAMAAVFNQ